MDPDDFASLLEREPAPTNAYTLELEGRLAEEIKGHNLASATVDSQARRIKSLEDVLVAIRADLGMMMLPSYSLQMKQEKILCLISETLDPCKPWCVLEPGHKGACEPHELARD